MPISGIFRAPGKPVTTAAPIRGQVRRMIVEADLLGSERRALAEQLEPRRKEQATVRRNLKGLQREIEAEGRPVIGRRVTDEDLERFEALRARYERELERSKLVDAEILAMQRELDERAKLHGQAQRALEAILKALPDGHVLGNQARGME